MTAATRPPCQAAHHRNCTASDDDPIVTLDLLPVTPEAVQRALARSRTSAA